MAPKRLRAYFRRTTPPSPTINPRTRTNAAEPSTSRRRRRSPRYPSLSSGPRPTTSQLRRPRAENSTLLADADSVKRDEAKEKRDGDT